MADTLIVNGHVLTMDAGLTEFAVGAIAINDGQIVAVGDQTDVQARYRSANTIDVSGGIVLPGLINTHCHAAMTLFRGTADDVALGDFLNTVWAAEARIVNDRSVTIGALVGFAEMALGGVTTVADMYWHPQSVVDASQRIGLSVATGPAFIGFAGIDGLDSWTARIDDAHDFLDRNKACEGVHLSLAPHRTYTLDKVQLSDLAQLAQQYDVLVQIHAAEAPTEMQDVQAKHGQSPIRVLAETGLLNGPCVVAHGVHLSDDDRHLLHSHDTAIAHCPQSNAKTAAGIAPVAQLDDAGITVSFGTDGASTGNDLDMWKTMRLASCLQKLANEDPRSLPARKAVQMATLGGAKALGLSDCTGSLEQGKRADITVVSTDSIHMQPLFDPYSALVYSAGRHDVQHVIARGKPVVADRAIVGADIGPILHEINTIAHQELRPIEARA